jgi:hypothetical protein
MKELKVSSWVDVLDHRAREYVHESRASDGVRGDVQVLCSSPKLSSAVDDLSLANARWSDEEDIEVWVDVGVEGVCPDSSLECSCHDGDSGPKPKRFGGREGIS